MKDNQMDKSLFFITLSCLCIWLVVDVAIGKNYLGNFLGTLFPFMKESDSVTWNTETVKEAAKNAPSSSAIGSGRGSGFNEDKSGGGTASGGRQSSTYNGGGAGYGVR